MATNKIVNGEVIPLTDEEIAEELARQKLWAPEPVLTPTKEQLMAQLTALSAQIQALE